MVGAPEISFSLCDSLSELEQIKTLQSANLKSLLEPEEQDREGFVTAVYSMDLLKKMNDHHRAILAKVGDRVVGYSLVVSPAFTGHHPLLDDLIYNCNLLSFKGRKLESCSYIVVGQLCVDKAFRKRGVAQGLYGHFQKAYAQTFEYCVTDVDRKNTRSLKTHRSKGFTVIGTLTYGGAFWDVVLWEWRN